MALCCTITSLAVAFVPETHGPTLQKWKNQKTDTPPTSLTFNQVMGVYKTAFSRPIIYLFTGMSIMFDNSLAFIALLNHIDQY